MHLLKIYCIKTNDVENFDSLFVVDLDKKRLHVLEDVINQGIYIENAVAIFLEPISDQMSFVFEYEDIDFLGSEFQRALLKYILEEFDPKTVGQIFDKMDNDFKEKETAELFAVFDIKSYESNHYQDPLEYDFEATYIGMLFKDLKIEKKQ